MYGTLEIVILWGRVVVDLGDGNNGWLIMDEPEKNYGSFEVSCPRRR